MDDIKTEKDSNGTIIWFIFEDEDLVTNYDIENIASHCYEYSKKGDAKNQAYNHVDKTKITSFNFRKDVKAGECKNIFRKCFNKFNIEIAPKLDSKSVIKDVFDHNPRSILNDLHEASTSYSICNLKTEPVSKNPKSVHQKSSKYVKEIKPPIKRRKKSTPSSNSIQLDLETIKIQETNLPNKHICQFCSFSCLTEGTLHNHIKVVHIETNVFKCEFCEFRTDSESLLDTHVQNVHKKKRFENSNVEKNATLYECKFCQYKTGGLGKLSYHLRRKHNERCECNHYHCKTVSSNKLTAFRAKATRSIRK